MDPSIEWVDDQDSDCAYSNLSLEADAAKMKTLYERLAELRKRPSYQTLKFDLAKHGQIDRQSRARPFVEWPEK